MLFRAYYFPSADLKVKGVVVVEVIFDIITFKVVKIICEAYTRAFSILTVILSSVVIS